MNRSELAPTLCRREALKRVGSMFAAGATSVALGHVHGASRIATTAVDDEKPSPFALNYVLPSAMYGKMPIEKIVREAPKTGTRFVDIWRLPHGNQREQIEKLGTDAFAAVLKKHNVSMGMTTIWGKDFTQELQFVKKFDGRVLVTGFVPEGKKNKPADIQGFLNKHRKQIALAEELGVTIAIENHGATPDEIRRFAEAAKSPRLGVALAPYHLPQDPKLLSKLIEDLGPKLALFYAWQHGKGAMKKLPKNQEMMQMPGFGPLDFNPLVAALKKIKYQGWTEIFMHPVPRGIPILPTCDEVTAVINKSRVYLDECVKTIG